MAGERKPRLDWIHGFLLGGVLVTVLFALFYGHFGVRR